MANRLGNALLVLIGTATFAFAQIGGLPFPGKHKKQQTEHHIAADGRVVSIDAKKLVVDVPDGRTLTMAVDGKTEFTKSGAKIGRDQVSPRLNVHVVAAEDDEWNLTAVTVDVTGESHPVAAAEHGQSDQPSGGAAGNQPEQAVEQNKIVPPQDAPDRPILRRGESIKSGNARTGTDEENPEQEPKPPAARDQESDFTITADDAPGKPGKSKAQLQLVSRAQDWAGSFLQGLPNYICQEVATASERVSKDSGWEPKKVLTAKIVFENGKERYEDITVDGKRTNKGMLETGGTSTTGEFASVLQNVMLQSTADFKYLQSTTLGEVPTSVFDLHVALPHSGWMIIAGGQTLRPEYKGSIWVDRSSAQIRRLELQAVSTPDDFPFDKIELAVDYDLVHLGTRQFLLPVRATHLACLRASAVCEKNEVEFRDYHRFAGESTIEYK